ncbi:hypothetical protein SB00610_03050 [Klebsiella quasipneumoniae subsp. similipneumoniae]|nr:hypothetical protein SB00610_03050 [Klebsiella quasipneumoniae subsp. similipneumoniae]
MTAHFCDGPVTLFEIMLNATGGAAGNGVFQQRMVRNDSEAIVFLLDFTDETGQEGLNQRFRFGAFAFFFRMDHRNDTVAMHHFFHLRRRNEVALLSVHFEEAKALFRALNDPFRTRRLGMQLLFKLR